jgi:AraC-like DNA-binding protein
MIIKLRDFLSKKRGLVMNQKTALTFLENALSRYGLKAHIIKDCLDLEDIDKGIRNFLGFDRIYQKAAEHMEPMLKPYTIYKVSDDFLSNYIFLQFSNADEPSYLIIGPYTEKDFSKELLMDLITKYEVPLKLTERLKEYFMNIPFLSDPTSVMILVETFAELVWTGTSYSYEEIQFQMSKDFVGIIPQYVLESITEPRDVEYKMQLIEERYQTEKNLMNCVAQGNYLKAYNSLAGFNQQMMEYRAPSRLQDYRNYAIILNTLLRKGAELGAVHPIHIDRLSSHFAKRIESISSFEHGKQLSKEMIRKYCVLVKSHSLKEYSLFIQKVITRVESDLTADQSLNTHAQLLNLTPSYLSKLFRRETGITLTDFVNKKRIEHSIFLLNTTDLPIQTIAQYCGVTDINYFTRLFKKQIGKTPSEYRKLLKTDFSRK